MGLGVQMIGWHEDFCVQLADRGFHVVRFDNRDVGRSTKMKGRPPTLSQMATRRFGPEQYTLEDMADDAEALLEALGLQPAHIVGASMGGMIGQTLAVRHPESVRSLTSIMSSTGNRFAGQPKLGIYRYLLGQAPREKEAYIDFAERVFTAVGSPGMPRDASYIRERAARSFDRGHNPSGTGRQLGAILASGDRTDQLRGIKAPTLVIHGTRDRLVSPSGGRATANAIPGAELLKIEGMGHDLPPAAWDQVVDGIVRTAARADRDVDRAAA